MYNKTKQTHTSAVKWDTKLKLKQSHAFNIQTHAISTRSFIEVIYCDTHYNKLLLHSALKKY
jgi:hypothetical protein